LWLPYYERRHGVVSAAVRSLLRTISLSSWGI